MNRPGRKPGRQRGQALTEYALISATVVAGFALASYVGIPQSIVARLTETREAYNIQFPDKFTPHEIGLRAQQFNDQISLK